MGIDILIFSIFFFLLTGELRKTPTVDRATEQGSRAGEQGKAAGQGRAGEQGSRAWQGDFERF